MPLRLFCLVVATLHFSISGQANGNPRLDSLKEVFSKNKHRIWLGGGVSPKLDKPNTAWEVLMRITQAI